MYAILATFEANHEQAGQGMIEAATLEAFHDWDLDSM